MEFLSIFNSIGTPALILLVLVILFFMIKENREENKRMAKRFDESQKSVNDKIQQFRDEIKREVENNKKLQNERDKKQDDLIEKMDSRLAGVERDYAKKIDIQEAVGGWRTELSKLGSRIDMLLLLGESKDGRRA